MSWRSADFSGIGVGDKEKNNTAVGDNAPGGEGNVIGDRVGAGSNCSQGSSFFSGVSSAEQGGKGGLHRASMLGHGQGSLLWCHPGDLERVRFCVCGGDRSRLDLTPF